MRLINADLLIEFIAKKYNIDKLKDENVAFTMIDLVEDIAEFPTAN